MAYGFVGYSTTSTVFFTPPPIFVQANLFYEIVSFYRTGEISEKIAQIVWKFLDLNKICVCDVF
jgi:hypothetical protein